jgi:phosphoglycolate phosphatase
MAAQVFSFDLVGFDLDGTLVDSAGDLAAAVNHALHVAGRAPLDVERVRPMIGGGSHVMLQRALIATGGDEDLDRLLPELLDFYDAHIADLTRPCPGAVEALDDLIARGVRLAVVTNKREYFSVKLLRTLGLLDRFACVIGGDTIPGKSKPDPAPIMEMLRRCERKRAVFVGDSIYDVQAAHAAGLPVALYAPANDLGADAHFADFGELIPALAAISRAP